MVKVPSYDDINRQSPGIRPDPVRSLSDAEIRNMSDIGLSRVGEGTKKVGKTLLDIEIKKQEEDNLLWVTSNIADFKTQIIENESTWQETHEAEDGKGFADYAESEFNKIKDSLLANAPNDKAREELAIKIEAYRPTALNSFIVHETNTRYAYINNEIGIAINKEAMLAYNDPINWELYLGSITKMFDNVIDIHGKYKEDYLTMLPPKKINAIKDTANNAIISNALEGLIDSDIKENIDLAINWIESGKFNDKVSEDTLIKLLNKAKSYKEKVGALAIKDLNDRITANINNVSINGDEFSPITLADFHAISDGTPAGLEEAEAKFLEYSSKIRVGKKVFANKESLTWMPNNKVEDYIENLEPPSALTDIKGDASRYNEEFDIWTGTTEMARNLLQWRQSDSFGYVLANDEKLKNRYLGLADDGSELEENFDKNAQYKLALDEIINLQITMGIKDIKYMSIEEEQNMIEMLQSKDGNLVLAYIQQERNKVGDWVDERLNQVITNGNLPAIHAAALMWIGEPQFVDLWKTVNISDTELNKSIAHIPMDEGAMATALATFQPYRISLTQNAPERVEFVNALQTLMVKKAKSLLAAGNYASMEEAMEQVVESYFGKNFVIGHDNNYLIPVKIKVGDNIKYIANDESQIEHINGVLNMLLAPKYLGTMDIAPLDSADPNISDLYQWRENAQTESNIFAWRNTSDGKGVELIWNFSGYPDDIRVYTKDKQPIMLTWEQVSLHHVESSAYGSMLEQNIEESRKSSLPLFTF